jgi:hypothetical protein
LRLRFSIGLNMTQARPTVPKRTTALKTIKISIASAVPIGTIVLFRWKVAQSAERASSTLPRRVGTLVLPLSELRLHINVGREWHNTEQDPMPVSSIQIFCYSGATSVFSKQGNEKSLLF